MYNERVDCLSCSGLCDNDTTCVAVRPIIGCHEISMGWLYTRDFAVVEMNLWNLLTIYYRQVNVPSYMYILYPGNTHEEINKEKISQQGSHCEMQCKNDCLLFSEENFVIRTISTPMKVFENPVSISCNKQAVDTQSMSIHLIFIIHAT